MATRGTKTRLYYRFSSYQPMQREPEFGFQSIIMIAVDTIAITVKNKGDKGGFCSY